jgi:Cu(I)/Ag(I) efflux system membrane fusion protein
MKKYIIYIAVLIVGLFLGWLLFGGAATTEKEHRHDTVSATSQTWTCAMHPQIMKLASGNCPICGMDLIPAESSAEGLMADQFKLTKNAMALANIQTSIIKSSKAENNEMKLSGKIVQNEAANVVQVSYFSGRIDQLNVRFTGEKIRKGQLLATIYSPELYAAQQEFITAASLKKTQPALYKAVRNKLKLWKLSESQIKEIEASGRVREKFPIYATVSGTVLKKLVAQGQAIQQGQPLFKISNLKTVWANFDVYENQINRFKKGQDILVTTNAFPNKEFKSKVDFISPVVDAATRTVKLRVVLQNEANIFKPGMFVEGKIKGISSSASKALMIPSTAVLWTGERSVIYLKATGDAPVFEMREITLGHRVDDTYEVLEGLNMGDEIVTNGTFTVDAAAQLQGKKSMMNRKAGISMSDYEGYLKKNTTGYKITDTKGERLEVSKEFQNQLKDVFTEYIILKDAFVKEESQNIIIQSKKIAAFLDQVDLNLLKNKDAYTCWMSLDNQLTVSTNSILKTATITAQRNYFKQLSFYLIAAVQLFGVNEKIFVTFCPMADGNKGAYWLSKEENVVNPYFGSAMLTCGEIKQVIE